MIDALFAQIGVTNRYFVEFGVESGVECDQSKPDAQARSRKPGHHPRR